LSLREPPRVRASRLGGSPGGATQLDGAAETSWRSEGGATPQWFSLDFGTEHE